MKLSEAMRRGAKMRPQAFQFVFIADGPGATCALGAAAEGMGILGACISSQATSVLRPLGEKVGSMLYDTRQQSPCGCIPIGWMLHNIIAHLNDVHRWSREAIAEWVEVIEGKFEVEQRQSPWNQDTVIVQAVAPVSGKLAKAL
jgi:hypothetical protein